MILNSENQMQNLTKEVKEFATKRGAHLVGIASVDRFKNAPKGHHPQNLLYGANSVIVIAKRFFQTILESDKICTDSEILSEEDLGGLHEFMFRFMYDTINMEMQAIGIDIAHFLHEEGYPTLPLPSSGWAGGPKGHHGVFSHRHAAVLAGLGEIGANNLLLTPKYGPRVRLNSIITTAELLPDPLVAEKLCPEEECMLCMKAKNCFGELYDLDLAGKRMKVARFQGCDKELCKRSNPNAPLPYIRYCIGVCPVGKE